MKLVEQKLLREIPTFGEIDNTSKAVKDQYEQNPYPRWVSLPLSARPVPLPHWLEFRENVKPSAVASIKNIRPTCLIAGCEQDNRQSID